MITFQTIDVEMPRIDQTQIRRWVEAVAAGYGRGVGDINYIFVDDEGILRVNRQFLHHDYYTDIITFDYSDTPARPPIAGDIFISLDTVRSNASLLHQPFHRELHRVIIHGILHLCGQNDKGPGERELMEAAENKSLDLLKHTMPLVVSLLLAVSCSSTPRPSQPDIDSCFTYNLPAAEATLEHNDIYVPIDSMAMPEHQADSLLADTAFHI